ncbi:MAG: 16S rRNA (cytosine(1402)-N(4))-methyltransferase RsmH [Candidatus Aureabacteria bacterium]|nr:16S rRNA (cytosine(1402)-N(4))-methyltransferase RsmH [Candidatus Auribacterota bacterium]
MSTWVSVHQPVLLKEVVSFFSEIPLEIFVDATVGAGGHARIILEQCLSLQGLLIGFDQDGDILKIAEKNLEPFSKQVKLIHENGDRMKDVMNRLQIKNVDGVLLDLGLSSFQLDSDRGFSFSKDSPLDMRMDVRTELTAFDVLNSYSPEQLRRILKEYGEFKYPSPIAQKILSRREISPIRTTRELAEIFEERLKKMVPSRIHPATRIFQAIRMEVNQELPRLKNMLLQAYELLKIGGRLAVISFHSLEDRMVKHFFRSKVLPCSCPQDIPQCMCGGIPKGRILTKKPVVPERDEIRENPRSRSAKLRVLEKI